MNLPPLQYLFDALRTDIGPPMVASAGLFVVLRFAGGEFGRRWAASTAFAVGLIAGNAITGHLPWRPELMGGWLSIIVAGLVASIGSPLIQANQHLIRGIGRALVGFAVFMVTPLELWSSRFWIPLAFMTAVAVLIVIIQIVDDPRQNIVAAALLSLNAGCLMALMMLAHSGRFAEIALMIAASLGGVALVAWRFAADVRPATVTAIVVLMGLLLAGQQETWSEVPLGSFLLMALAPVGLLARRFVTKWPKSAMSVGVMTPLIAALAWAMMYESPMF